MSDYRLAQTSVLGSMLIDERVVGRVVTTLREDDFTDDIGRQIFTAIRSLYIDGEKVDPVLVLDKLGEGTAERRKYLLAVMDVTPTAANVDEYVAIVKSESCLRQLRSIGEQIFAAPDISDIRALALRANNLLAGRETVRSISLEEGITRFYDNLTRPVDYIKWGMSAL